ncbi:MAG: phosphatase PAP2 family protein [Candidatus Velthaea sp.]
MTGRLLAAAGISGVLFVALGMFVVRHPLSRLDAFSATWRGEQVPLATALTVSGYGLTLTLLGLGSVAAAAVLRFPIEIPLTILVSQLASQALVNASKGIFARARPDAWLYRHEPGFSYPSGHATTAVVFYGAWAMVVWASPLPAPWRIGGVALLAAWALGIGWSRIALGAHYPTDVVGGFLFGLGWGCFVFAAAINAGLRMRAA